MNGAHGETLAWFSYRKTIEIVADVRANSNDVDDASVCLPKS